MQPDTTRPQRTASTTRDAPGVYRKASRESWAASASVGSGSLSENWSSTRPGSTAARTMSFAISQVLEAGLQVAQVPHQRVQFAPERHVTDAG